MTVTNSDNNKIEDSDNDNVDVVIEGNDEVSSNNDSNNCKPPLHFPCDEYTSFDDACLVAAETGRRLLLSGDVTLHSIFRLRVRQHLHIEGCCFSSSSTTTISLPPTTVETTNSSSKNYNKDKCNPCCTNSAPITTTATTTATISGSVHSLFMLNNHSQLTLENIKIKHLLDTNDCRKVGAAVNLRYKSKVTMKNSHIISYSGFCCWGVQKTSMLLKSCYFESPTRSAIVCFGGQPTCYMENCSIVRPGVHGVCVRGECILNLKNCNLIESTVRAIYAYANAKITLINCTITKCIRIDHAAIEVSSASSERQKQKQKQKQKQQTSKQNGKKKNDNLRNEESSTASLIMRGCVVTNNAGVGVRLRGSFHYEVDENHNTISNNDGGNIEFLSELDLPPDTATDTNEQDQSKKDRNNKSNGGGSHHRDAIGSSFRKGDWWCSRCNPPIAVMGRLLHCPKCNDDRSNGRLLTSQEIFQCNRNDASVVATADTTTTTATTTTSQATNTKLNSLITDKGNDEKRENTSTTTSWWFDGGDDKRWIRYDEESCKLLEDAYQQCCFKGERGGDDDNIIEEEDSRKNNNQGIVILSGGKYQVNVLTMEQINIQSKFLRFVKRQPNEK